MAIICVAEPAVCNPAAQISFAVCLIACSPHAPRQIPAVLVSDDADLAAGFCADEQRVGVVMSRPMRWAMTALARNRAGLQGVEDAHAATSCRRRLRASYRRTKLGQQQLAPVRERPQVVASSRFRHAGNSPPCAPGRQAALHVAGLGLPGFSFVAEPSPTSVTMYRSCAHGSPG